MAFSTTIQHAEKPAAPPSHQPANNISDVLLSAILLSVYGAQMSKKTVRKLKRKLFFASLKHKLKSLFKPRRDFSDRELLYIIGGAILIAIIILSPVVGLILLLIGLALILGGVV